MMDGHVGIEETSLKTMKGITNCSEVQFAFLCFE